MLHIERVRGCLLAGAVGDALGGAVEFWSLREIRDRYGAGGIRDYGVAYGRVGAITDDTQMTLFTAEALVRAELSGRDRREELHLAYLRWLQTQGTASLDGAGDGWLLHQHVLHARRGPGNTCLSALSSGGAGATDSPINDSKGCGGIMRAAPAGLVGADDAFALGCELAAITHGHPAGYLPAGVLAAAVARLLGGATLHASLQIARAELCTWTDHGETLAALDAGIALGAGGVPSGEELERLGGGWTGEEALAIAVACALGASEVHDGLIAAVNHSGDSDSTGAIAGNLLGATHGVRSIPERWLVDLEAREVIEQVAGDIGAVFGEPGAIDGELLDRYGVERRA